MANVKSENFINIQGWMISELRLKNTELLIYAIIYGFSQDGQGRFRGTLGYLMDWTQASKQTVLNALKSLADRGLIIKEELPQLNGQRGVEYRALTPDCSAPKPRTDTFEPDPSWEDAPDGGLNFGRVVKKIDHDGLNFRPNQSKNLTEVVKKLDPDNKIIINNNLSDTNIRSSAAADGASTDDGGNQDPQKRTSSLASQLSEEFEALWKLYPRKQGKDRAGRAYRAARRAGVSAETIRAGIEAYNERIDREQIGMNYIVHGGNWFAGHRWEDDNTPHPLPDGGAQRRPNNRALNYKQQHYTSEQLAAMGIDFGNDVYLEDAT